MLAPSLSVEQVLYRLQVVTYRWHAAYEARDWTITARCRRIYDRLWARCSPSQRAIYSKGLIYGEDYRPNRSGSR